MPTYKTPDVYIEEISVFPPSVAEVETAIPAFIGYTEKAIRNAANDLNLKPTKIYSLKEYEQYYGYPKDDTIAINVTSDSASGFTVSSFTEPTLKYLMYYSVKMFFDNGGGQCYIISVGNYQANAINLGNTTTKGLLDGLNALELEDEPTLIVIPEAVKLTSTEYPTLVKEVLKQCEKLRDRFAIFDLYNGDKDLNETPTGANSNYLTSNRDYFGNNSLKYGAVYYPFLKTTLNFYVNDGETNVSVTPPKGSGAGATATISNGEVIEIKISPNGNGTGYTSAPNVNIAAPSASGTQAVAIATISSTGANAGTVIEIKIDKSGSGYTTAPTIIIDPPPASSGGTTASATATISMGVVTGIKIDTGGLGYMTAPTIKIADPPVGGTTASATATSSNGMVTGISILTGGTGYTSAPKIDFTPSDPVAASQYGQFQNI